MPKPTPEDERDANTLLFAGWRQGSVFRPPAGTELSVHGGFDANTEFLIVCTQSCNVVSSNFDGNPLVEVMVARPLPKHSERSREATGRNVRTFHMLVNGSPEVAALACDVIRRCFLQRRVLLDCQPGGLDASRQAARSFAGWLSRYYGRAAFPNELVKRAKELFAAIEKALVEPGPSGRPLDEGIQYIYAHVSTDDELEPGDGRHYEMQMRFLCHDQGTAEALDRLLIHALKQYEEGAVHNGVSFTYEAGLTAQTFVADLNGYERFPEWDHLSGLEDARSTYASPLPQD